MANTKEVVVSGVPTDAEVLRLLFWMDGLDEGWETVAARYLGVATSTVRLTLKGKRRLGQRELARLVDCEKTRRRAVKALRERMLERIDRLSGEIIAGCGLARALLAERKRRDGKSLDPNASTAA